MATRGLTGETLILPWVRMYSIAGGLGVLRMPRG